MKLSKTHFATEWSSCFMFKKILSIILCFGILCSIIPQFNEIAFAAGIDNIAARADYLYNITWTAQKTVTGWKNNYTYKQGNLYRIPYGQPISSGKYIGWEISVDEFISSTNNSTSEFYNSKSYNNYNVGSYSAYYAMDCSAFASFCWDLPNRITTSSWSSLPVTNYGKCTSANVNKIEKGDALNLSGSHIVIVSDISYNSDGNISQIEITEQTPPQIKRSYYTAAKLASKYSSYTIYRYNKRDSVSAPPIKGNDPIYNLDLWSGGIGTINVRGWAFDEDDTSQSIPVHIYVGGPAGDPNAEGYPITANVFRDDVNAVYGCGNYHGFDASIKVTKTGAQPIFIYACNIGSGSTRLIAQKTVTITSPDTEAPIINNARTENLTNQGYDVVCNVTDNLNVNRVQFVTWSDNNGQDDIASGWETNPIVSGTKNANGEYTFHVNISEHLGDRGLYSTHIYAYDDYGNYSGYPITVTIPGYDYCLDEIILSNDSIYIKGWAAAINGFDRISAILTDDDDKSISYNITNRYYRSDVEDLRPSWNTSLAGFSETFDISSLKTGNITLEVRGTTDNLAYTLYNNSIVYNDTEAPIITNARIVDITNQGYTVVCDVTDNANINRVQFVTWSDNNGRDDSALNWETNPIITGTRNSSGEYEFNVSIWEHLGDRGLYYTHIYAYDDYGNYSGYPVTAIIPGYDANFEEATLDKRNLTVSGWAASINGIENIKFTVTDRKGKTNSYDVTNRFSREDVTSLRPDWNTENAGYNQTFDLSDLASGSAVIEIQGELYQEGAQKRTYSLGKKVIDLKDDLSVEVSVNNNEYMTGETVEISVNSAGEESLYLNIYNENGLYDTINIDSGKKHIKTFDKPGNYFVNAEAIGYKERLLSDNVYFTIIEEMELEPDAEKYGDVIVTKFEYQRDDTNGCVKFSALNVPETAIIYIATYDIEGRLLQLQTPTLLNGSVEVTLMLKNIYKIKAFVWERSTLKPLAMIEELKV